MALLNYVSTLGNGVTLTIVFDDSAMKLMSILANNPSNKILRFNITSPIIWNREISSGGSLNVTLPSGTRPNYKITSFLKDGNLLDMISGIEWRITLGI